MFESLSECRLLDWKYPGAGLGAYVMQEEEEEKEEDVEEEESVEEEEEHSDFISSFFW